jgi:hypoxanthine phosphoribosyltransferase
MGSFMRILIPAEQIQHRVAELAGLIAFDYRDRPVTIVGVLTGSLMFLADFVRRLDTPLRIGLIQASSYRGVTSGQLTIGAELLADVRGRHVLLLDDVLDSGQTLAHLVKHLQDQGALSVKVGVLLRKQGRQVHAVAVDFVGFEIPDEFVVGYGLDFNDEYRQLPYIAVLPKAMYT